jgi:hypothetical protein
MAELFGQAATHAPQPMQAAASNALSAFRFGNGHGVAVHQIAVRVHAHKTAGGLDAVERAPVHDKILDHRKCRSAKAPRGSHRHP